MVRAGVDNDPVCEFAYSYNNNAEFINKSVTDLHSKDIEPFYCEHSLKLLAGCAPCQTFSTYNIKARYAEEKDERWFLLLEFARLVKEMSPDFVAMENVTGLAGQDVFSEFVTSLQDNGYSVSFRVLSCDEYGVPQARRRLILLASKLGEINLLTPEEFGAEKKTVRDAIGSLPPLVAGEESKDDRLHQCISQTPLNMKRLRASKPGGNWKTWPEELVADCHKKDSGKHFYSSYSRMEWDKPAPTITTKFLGFGNGRFGHPEQDRAISLREGAILQSFPTDYQFTEPGEPIYRTHVARLIGNAVPVKLGEVIGKSIMAHLVDLEKGNVEKQKIQGVFAF